MITISGIDKGIICGDDITVQLNKLLNDLGKIDEPKTLILQKGTYFISSNLCEKETLFITNTMSDRKWKKNEIPHQYGVAINIKNIDDLIVDGNGAEFIIDGQVNNIVMQNCSNITLSNITIKTNNPNLHEFKVLNTSKFYVDFELDEESKYVANGKSFNFIGKDYVSGFKDFSLTDNWVGKISYENLNQVKVVKNPLRMAMKISQLKPNVFRVFYPFKKNFKINERFYLFDVRRRYVGIFINQCKNIILNNLTQNFNYSLAIVAQDSENLTIQNSIFAPCKSSKKLMTSVADFIQICMCKGDIIVKDCFFEGSADDCLNVHGIHFKVTKIVGKRLKVAFCHCDSHGFNPLHVGDRIEFVDTKSLLPKGNSKIVSSQILDEYNIQLEVDNVDGLEVGDVIEDIDRCPNLHFAGNEMSRIMTRGLLITTRGKVVVENNHFKNTSMNSIVFSDDAKLWFESGRVLDVTIRNNTFDDCLGYNIFIKPENTSMQAAVHSNFVIEKNNFNSFPNGGIFIKCTENVVIKDNITKGKLKLITIESNNISEINNKELSLQSESK